MIAEALSAQGFSDISMQREGPILTIKAQRAGQPTELVYSTANGRLVSVDGVQTRRAPEDGSGLDESDAGTTSGGDGDGDVGSQGGTDSNG